MRTWTPWLRAYGVAFLILAAGTAIGLARTCVDVGSNALTVGCSDKLIGRSWPGFFGTWAVYSGIAGVLGLVLTRIMQRRPTVASFSVWFSVGVIWEFSHAWNYLPWVPPVPVWFLTLVAVESLGVAAGVSAAKKWGDFKDARERAVTS